MRNDLQVPKELENNVTVTTWAKLLSPLLSGIYNWGRKRSMWPFGFGLACCAFEAMATGAGRFDLARFGMELARPSPRQADLVIVSGTVTKKMVPLIVRLYNQMPEPKYVIAMGACAISGGPFKEGYNVVSGMDKFIPVDVYIPGCPPRPEALLHGFLKLFEKIDAQTIATSPWYSKTGQPAIPVPLLGPDLIDLRYTANVECERQASVTSATVTPPTHKPAATLAQLTPAMASLQERFGDAVQPAEYEGLVIANDRLIEVARAIRDDLGYEYLSSLTGVDYFEQGYCEVVYHAYSTRGGGPLVFKARTPRDVNAAEVPSVVSVWPGAEFQEREAYDMFGIHFGGHPDLRRILMWESFAGYPLRKDWREAYYEQEHKPFDSRWPSGRHSPAEERARFHDNLIVSPQGVSVESITPDKDTLLYESLLPNSSGGDNQGLHTDSVIVNIGPQHPSTHGIFRMTVRLNGETVEDIKPVIGYLHRNHEKIGERNTYVQNMPYTDRLDYVCAMSNNFAYALAVEKLLGLKPPERAEYIRVIMAELTRVMNHLLFCGFLMSEMGAWGTPFMYAFEERELILDLFEMASGARMMCNYFRFGGVARDLPDGCVERLRHLVYERLPRKTDEMEALMTDNEIVRSRAIGVAVLPRDQAIALSAAGPLLRASGVPYDVRKAEPYSIYDRFDFDIVTRPNGDVYDRYVVRVGEIRQSLRILKQALDQLPAGEIQAGKKQYQVRVPAGQAYGRVEAPKGELGFYVVSDGSPNPYRYHIRATSFINLQSLATMVRGGKLADAIIGLGSIDTTMGEVDR